MPRPTHRYRPPPSAEMLDCERDHNARRRVVLLASIEREAAELGLGPTTRLDALDATTVVAANGAPIATVRLRRRDGEAAYPSLAGEKVVAELAAGGEYWPGQLALAIAG